MAQLKASEAAVSQAEANLNQAQVDLDHTIIRTPIDGVVINRAVDVGQTVAASFQAPVLFIIANDLTRMQVNAAVDEADIGRVRDGPGRGRSAWTPTPTAASPAGWSRCGCSPRPSRTSSATTPSSASTTPSRRLMPGMTATVSIVVNKAENVLRLPAAALRFRPEGFITRSAGGRPCPGAGRGGI